MGGSAPWEKNTPKMSPTESTAGLGLGSDSHRLIRASTIMKGVPVIRKSRKSLMSRRKTAKTSGRAARSNTW